MPFEVIFSPWSFLIFGLIFLIVVGWIVYGRPKGGGPSPCDVCTDDTGVIASCANTPQDSQCNGGITRIRSQDHGGPTFQLITTRDPETVEVMVHEPAAVPSAVVVLIAGGQLNAGIDAAAADPLQTVAANFLVRSAHLFAGQGFRAVTIDRPSDWASYLDGVGPQGWRFDPYRINVNHCIDLSEVINATNPEGLPVVLAGTSRGAISAYCWQKMADAISLSSPVTSGNGFPIGAGASFSFLRPAALEKPACVHWSPCDGCPVTTPAAAQSLLDDLTDQGIAGTGGGAIGGGYRGENPDPCSALTWHGFLGVETCAVQAIASCLQSALTSFDLVLDFTAVPFEHPVPILSGTSVQLSLRDHVKADAESLGPLRFGLPADRSSFSGKANLSISGDSDVTYLAPTVEKPSTDRFVFTFTRPRGRVAHAVASIKVNP